MRTMSRVQFEIRTPGVADINALADMFFEIHEKPSEEYGACTREAGVEWAKSFCDEKTPRVLEGKPVHALTLFIDKRALGWATVIEDSPRVGGRGWYLNGLEVRPYCRNNGLGAALVQALASLVRMHDRDLYVAVRRDHPSSLKMFRNCGFGDVQNIGHFAPTVSVMVRKKG